MSYISIKDAKEIAINSRVLAIEKIKISEAKDYYAGSIVLDNKILAAYCIYVENDITEAKNYYYEAALANKFRQSKFDYWIGGVFNNLLYPLLSDNKQIINELQNIIYDKESERVGTINFYLCKAFQAILRNDNLELEKYINLAYKRNKTPLGKVFEGLIISYEGFLANNESKVFEGVALLQKKIQKDQNPVIGKHMNFEATGLAKLAWRKGFEIDFKNKFIPQALLPVKELDHYESFDFFKES